MTTKYPYSQALAKSLTEKLGGLAFVLPGGDVQCDTPDGTLTVYADGAVRVRECGETEAWPTLRSAVADWGGEMGRSPPRRGLTAPPGPARMKTSEREKGTPR